MTIKFASAVAAAIIAAGAAHAGGFTAPTVDVSPVEPVVIAAEPGDWAGAYAGVTLGYAFGGDDEVGAFAGDTFLGNLGTEDLSGAIDTGAATPTAEVAPTADPTAAETTGGAG